MKHNETKEQRMFIKWFELQYPNVNYIVDLYSFMLEKQRFSCNGMRKTDMPDIFIALPNNGYCGLFIEMKKTGTVINKKNGDAYADMVDQQNKLNQLSDIGYMAVFACGFDEAKRIITEYMK